MEPSSPVFLIMMIAADEATPVVTHKSLCGQPNESADLQVQRTLHRILKILKENVLYFMSFL